MTAAGDAGKHPWSDLEIPAHVHADECPMGVRLTRDKPCVRCFAQADEGCRQYPTALETKVARLAADLAAARADAAKARDDALEEAARIADEWGAENLRMAMDSIHLDPALARADFSPEAQKMTDKMQAHGAHHAGAYAGCEQVAKAIRTARTAGGSDGRS